MSNTEIGQSLPTPQPGFPPPVPPKGSNGLATAGFVLGLLGLLSSWIPFLNIIGIILGVLGAILAAVGLAKSKKVNAGKGLAIAGLVLGVLAVIFAIVVNAVFVSAVDSAIDETTDTNVEAPAKSGGDTNSKDGSSDDELGTTRDNPAPLGSKITGDDWTVKINSVKTAKSDSMSQQPAAGSTLLVVNLTATYTGDDEQGQTPWTTIKFVTQDGKTIGTTDGSTMFIPDNGFDSLSTVYEGASVTGDEMIEVPSDGWEKGVFAISPGMLSDDTFVAVK